MGEERLAPDCNDYKEWIQYQTYDVTQALQQPDQLVFHPGNGWHKGRFGLWSHGLQTGFYGSEWKLIAGLTIDDADGTKETI